ncbi:MAG: gliding motility protein GldM [Chlorobi bacterium]|nr:gliding motility protein GldM [Chlorobiota bacterium]
MSGHGKLSPRQKMINMMYLILTALLAMNVSAEILNAFVLVNDSLIKTEKGINGKNAEVYAAFASKYEANKNKVGPWKAKADEVNKLSKSLVDKITEFQKTLLEADDEDYEKFLEEGTATIKNKKDKETPTRIMLEEKVEGGKNRATVLKEKIDEFVKEVEKVLADVPSAKGIIKSMKDNLNTGNIKGEGGEEKTWQIANFDQLPLVAAITMLTKFKTDVLNSESDAINTLLAQVDAKSYKFTNLNAIVKTEKGYVLSGETYTAQIFVAASDTTQRPTIVFDNGTTVDSFDSQGRGIYSVKTGAPGIYTLKGKILVQKPGTSELDSFPFESQYQVAVPSVSVSPDKMNVFYIGVDNPVTVTAAGTPADQIRASVAGGSMIPKGNSKYIVRVKKPGKTRVTVTANGRTLGSKEFRVKTLPDPITTLGAKGTPYYKGGPCPKSTLVALSGINATMENFDFELRYRITQFIVTCNIGGFDESAKSNSRRFTPQQKAIIKKAKRNSRVIIEGVKAVGPDNRTRKINDLVLKLR